MCCLELPLQQGGALQVERRGQGGRTPIFIIYQCIILLHLPSTHFFLQFEYISVYIICIIKYIMPRTIYGSGIR